MCRRILSFCLVHLTRKCKQGIRSLMKFGCEEVRKTIHKCILQHLLKLCSSRWLLKMKQLTVFGVMTLVRTTLFRSLKIPVETLAEISWKIFYLEISLEEQRKSCCIYVLQRGKCKENVSYHTFTDWETVMSFQTCDNVVLDPTDFSVWAKTDLILQNTKNQKKESYTALEQHEDWFYWLIEWFIHSECVNYPICTQSYIL